jgi:hypothetical protein
MQSIRENRIDAQRYELAARRLADCSGRPTRHDLIAREECRKDGQTATDRFEEALQELQDLGIYCLDPVRGEALVPFVQEQQLAWFVYDLFAEEPIRSWRFHTDSFDMRRPITTVTDGPPGPIAVA